MKYASVLRAAGGWTWRADARPQAGAFAGAGLDTHALTAGLSISRPSAIRWRR